MKQAHEAEFLRAHVEATEFDGAPDLAWFEAHPDRMLRLRPATPAEIMLDPGNPLFDPPLGPEEREELAVIVLRLEEGGRIQRPIHLRIPAGLTLKAISAAADDARCKLLWGTKCMDAIEYARRGYAVIPITPDGPKARPLVSPRKASRNPPVINRWWTHWPHADVGCVVGKREFCVLHIKTSIANDVATGLDVFEKGLH
jgi:hypothetical protein